MRDGLRSFSGDAIETLEVLDASAMDIPKETVEAQMGGGVLSPLELKTKVHKTLLTAIEQYV